MQAYHMPALCDETRNPCFNGGACKIISGTTLECSCKDGFSGDFCEFKTEQDHLSAIDYYSTSPSLEFIQFIFNPDGSRPGRPMKKKTVVDENAGAWFFCSTMFNGESVIIGGIRGLHRQVHFKNINISLKYYSS